MGKMQNTEIIEKLTVKLIIGMMKKWSIKFFKICQIAKMLIC